MPINKCTDFYYKTIELDPKNLIILKSESLSLLEEAKSILVDHFKKSKSTDLMVIKKEIHYEIDFLLQFKGKQFALNTEVKNLVRLLRIRRDDYILFDEKATNENNGSNVNTLKKEIQTSDENNNQQAISSMTPNQERSRTFSFNLNAKPYSPSKERQLSTSETENTRDEKGDVRSVKEQQEDVAKDIVNCNEERSTSGRRARNVEDVIPNESDQRASIEELEQVVSDVINEQLSKLDEQDDYKSTSAGDENVQSKVKSMVEDYTRKTQSNVQSFTEIEKKIDSSTNNQKIGTKVLTHGLNSIGRNFDVRNMK